MTDSPSSEILLPAAAAQVLGYSPKQMRILHEHGVISHLAHRVGCGTFYRFTELLRFRRQLRLDRTYDQFIRELTNEAQDDDS